MSSVDVEFIDEHCYSSNSITPLYILALGAISSLFINSYMFFNGETIQSQIISWCMYPYISIFMFIKNDE